MPYSPGRLTVGSASAGPRLVTVTVTPVSSVSVSREGGPLVVRGSPSLSPPLGAESIGRLKRWATRVQGSCVVRARVSACILERLGLSVSLLFCRGLGGVGGVGVFTGLPPCLYAFFFLYLSLHLTVCISKGLCVSLCWCVSSHACPLSLQILAR